MAVAALNDFPDLTDIPLETGGSPRILKTFPRRDGLEQIDVARDGP